jgi:hypothetical protein
LKKQTVNPCRDDWQKPSSYITGDAASYSFGLSNVASANKSAKILFDTITIVCIAGVVTAYNVGLRPWHNLTSVQPMNLLIYYTMVCL